jgi:eukaryotic-like serine/threonine-protein kinase
MLRECLAIREKKEPDAWTTSNTQIMLGAALLGQKEYAEAEPLLLTGYEGMKAREKTIPKSGRDDLPIPEALDRLIEFYAATAKPEEAKKYRELRAKYPDSKPAEKR